MITSIRLQNYRSYNNDSFEFENSVNIIVGPNASGKTNLLEAILVICRGSSYRGRDAELIRIGKPWARIDAVFDKHDRILKIEKNDLSTKKTYIIDDKQYLRLPSDKTEKVVYFEPNHLQLLQRGPEARRDYIDELLEQFYPDFRIINRSYKRALAQRNSLLKQNPHTAKSQLFAWDIRLSELGEKVSAGRQNLVDEVNKQLSSTYSHIAGKKAKINLIYESQFPIAGYGSRLLSKLQSSTAVDFDRGFTGHGPHREDFTFLINAQPASATASRGESRSILLALKMFEIFMIEKIYEKPPLFLLDDVFSELDGSRRHALVEFLKDRQTIITTTDADTVTEYFARGNQHLISVLAKP
jgi:DNA replication and repair protein RecF